MSQPPWASGPSEILRHGLSLLQKDSDKNRRLALLSIDNAVELTIKTYLSLPRRVTNINLSRKDFQEISESFPKLLDTIEHHAAGKLDGIDLGEIEWYHRLRNELYHQGNGLTVERDKVEVYAQLAKLIFRRLFDYEIETEKGENLVVLGDFIEAWARLEQMSFIAAGMAFDEVDNRPKKARATGPITIAEIFRRLAKGKYIDASRIKQIDELRNIRNSIIHGEVDHKSILNHDILLQVKTLEDEIVNLISEIS